MATYDYYCANCDVVDEVQHSMDEVVFVTCSRCFHRAEKYFSVDSLFQTQEDRRHMRGERLSPATGQTYAQSRRDERIIEKERGIYFVGKSEQPEQWKTLAEHFRYTKSGGTPLHPDVLNPPPDGRIKPGTIMEMVRKRGIRFGAR